MHELSICQALIAEVARIANAEQAAFVSDVHVSVGPLSGIEHKLLQNAFPIAAAGTVAKEARLHLSQTSVRIRCPACGDESDVPVNRLACPHCGNFRTQLLSGDELLLLRVVFEGTGEARV